MDPTIVSGMYHSVAAIEAYHKSCYIVWKKLDREQYGKWVDAQ